MPSNWGCPVHECGGRRERLGRGERNWWFRCEHRGYRRRHRRSGQWRHPYGRTGSGYLAGDLSNSDSKGCGAFLEVTGPSGSVVGIVNEVADIAAVGQYGQPGNVTLEQSYLLGISTTAGPQRAAYRPVPCPVTTGIGFRCESWDSGNPWLATYITVIHHRHPPASLEIRPQGTTTSKPNRPRGQGTAPRPTPSHVSDGPTPIRHSCVQL